MRKLLLGLIIAISLSFTYKSKKFKGPEGFQFIPSGTTANDGKSYSCAAFWMMDHEVTNYEYRSFLKALNDAGRDADYKAALPDTTQWSTIGDFNHPYIKYYFSHPAYDSYPVVNITKEGANLFCKYLTEHYRSQYGDVINDFRLPTKLEWIYAARGGLENSPYPWGGPYLRNEEGEVLANYKVVGDHNITTKEDGTMVILDSLTFTNLLSTGGDVTAPSDTYGRNDYGLFHMSGNVAEMTAKENLAMGGHWNSTGYDVRVNSEIPFEKANPFVGFRPVLSYSKIE